MMKVYDLKTVVEMFEKFVSAAWFGQSQCGMVLRAVDAAQVVLIHAQYGQVCDLPEDFVPVDLRSINDGLKTLPKSKYVSLTKINDEVHMQTNSTECKIKRPDENSIEYPKRIPKLPRFDYSVRFDLSGERLYHFVNLVRTFSEAVQIRYVNRTIVLSSVNDFENVHMNLHATAEHHIGEFAVKYSVDYLLDIASAFRKQRAITIFIGDGLPMRIESHVGDIYVYMMLAPRFDL